MILLTRELNEMLEDNGFPELTVRRTDDGYLNLVGRKCGMPILSFDTMSISKKLTAAERKILKDDYIIPVITKYKKELVTLITELKDKTIQETIDTMIDDAKKDGYKLSSYTSFNHRTQNTTTLSFTAKSDDTSKSAIQVDYNVENKEFSVSMSSNSVKKIATAEKHIVAFSKEIVPLQKRLIDFMKLHDDLEIKKDRLAAARKDMIEKCSL